MNDTWMTIVGNVVEDPRKRETKNGHKVTNFRVASTSRRYDREQERYIDNETLYVNVTCWRAQAMNVADSLRKGHPVVVYGRYYTRDYRVEDQVRTSYELEATAVGHDLSRGVSSFRRMNRSAPPVVIAVDEQGIPKDESEHWLDLAEPVDPHPGEVVPSDADAEPAPPDSTGAPELEVV